MIFQMKIHSTVEIFHINFDSTFEYLRLFLTHHNFVSLSIRLEPAQVNSAQDIKSSPQNHSLAAADVNQLITQYQSQQEDPIQQGPPKSRICVLENVLISRPYQTEHQKDNGKSSMKSMY